MASTEYESLTVAELQEICSERGLVTSGTKAEIIQRLRDDDEAQAVAEVEEEEGEAPEEELIVPPGEEAGYNAAVMPPGRVWLDIPPDEVIPADQEVDVRAQGTGDLPIIRPGAWVQLGSTQAIPIQFRGELAAVMSAQIFEADGSEPDATSPRPYEYQPDNARFLVRVRGITSGSILELERKDFVKASNQGRNSIEGRG